MLKRALPYIALLVLFVLMRFLMPVKPPAHGSAAPPATTTAATTTTAPATTPPPPQPANPSAVNVGLVEDEFQALERITDPTALQAKVAELEQTAKQEAQYDTEHTSGLAKLLHLQATATGNTLVQLGYAQELLPGAESDNYADALTTYSQAERTPYSAIAFMRVAQVESHLERENAKNPLVAKDARSKTINALERLTNAPQGPQTLWRDPPAGPGKPVRWEIVDARETAAQWLDTYYRADWRYQIFNSLVHLTGAKKPFSYIFAIVLMALIAKLITTPFTASQFRSMRKMSALQPELKKLQEKYKDNKEEMAKAQMALFKEQGVNPASSCLPMILQLVILWQVYYAIRHFLFQFWGVHFLYLHNLALPDVMPGAAGFPGPLLILYAVSMYFSTKLTSMPAATPEQQTQQRMMSVMMPVMLLFFLKGLPAAFILYWLLQNILMTGHQWLIMRPHREAMMAANAGAVSLKAETPKEKALTPPPPAAIARISQGTKPSQQKKKRKK